MQPTQGAADGDRDDTAQAYSNLLRTELLGEGECPVEHHATRTPYSNPPLPIHPFCIEQPHSVAVAQFLTVQGKRVTAADAHDHVQLRRRKYVDTNLSPSSGRAPSGSPCVSLLRRERATPS